MPDDLHHAAAGGAQPSAVCRPSSEFLFFGTEEAKLSLIVASHQLAAAYWAHLLVQCSHPAPLCEVFKARHGAACRTTPATALSVLDLDAKDAATTP